MLSAISDGPKVSDANLPWLSAAMNGLLHVFLIASLLVFGYVLFRLTLDKTDGWERGLRATALFTGALIVLGAEAAGRSYSEFIIGSLADAKPFVFGIFGVIVPAASGTALAWYMLRSMRKSVDKAMRFLALFGSLAIAQFALMYGAAVSDQGFEVGRTAVPNMSFIVGMFVFMIFAYDPNARASQPARALSDRLPWRRSSQPQTTRGSLFEDR